MEFALFLNTHGVGTRDDHDWWHQPMNPAEMRPVESAQLAERLGFHSVFMGDHVAMPEQSPESVSPGHLEGASDPEVRQRGTAEDDVGGSKRHYPPRPSILDGAVVMGAIATHTSRIKMGPSVLIAPYRHPLSDARQFATIDYLSNGRLIMGVGAGWMKEEFDALGQPHASRLQMLEECIQVYDRCWTEPLASFQGDFHRFENIAMDPKPVRKPRPPIVVGATTKAGARVAARHSDGLMPILARPHDQPQQCAPLQDEIRREAAKIGRDPSEIAMLGTVSMRITDAGDPEATRRPRRSCGGTAEQILSDLERFAEAGYSLIWIAPDCPSRTYAEYREQVERFAAEVMPEGKKLRPQGEWRTDL